MLDKYAMVYHIFMKTTYNLFINIYIFFLLHLRCRQSSLSDEATRRRKS